MTIEVLYFDGCPSDSADEMIPLIDSSPYGLKPLRLYSSDRSGQPRRHPDSRSSSSAAASPG
jgi:hypothetical protein